jgi:hypothetical protein
MKNKIKTNNTSFQSYLTRVTNENFEKIKEDRYAYDEGKFLDKAKEFLFGKNKNSDGTDGGDYKASVSKRKKGAQETAKNIGPVIVMIKDKISSAYDSIQTDFNSFYAEDKSYAKAAFRLIKKYIAKFVNGITDSFSKMFKKLFGESKQSKYKKDINIFTEATKTTKYVKIGGKYVSGIFTYNFNGTDYVVNTLISPMTFTVKNFMATPNFPTIDDAWKSILGKDYNTLQAEIKTVTPDEQQIEFDQPLFNTKIRPFLIGEGDAVSTKAEQKDKEREDKLKLNVAETKRDVKKIDSRTERMETSIQNIDQRTLQTFVSQNRILIGIIVIAALLAVIIGLMIYGFNNINDTLSNMQSDNAIRYMDNKLDVLSVKKEVQDGFKDVAQRIQIKDQADIARYGNVLNTITQSTDDAANKVIKEVGTEIQNAKTDIVNKIGKSSATLQTLITKNGLSINQAKFLIKNINVDLNKMAETVKEQNFENTKTIISAVSDSRDDILKEMEENNDTNKALLNTIETTTVETAKGLYADGKKDLLGFVDKVISDAEERLTKEKLEALQRAAAPSGIDNQVSGR